MRSFKTETAAGPRSAILACLQTLLELRRPDAQDSSAAAAVAGGVSSGLAAAASDSYTAAELVEMARELQAQYVRNKTLTPTHQGEILQTLGLLLELGGEVGISLCVHMPRYPHGVACTAPARRAVSYLTLCVLHAHTVRWDGSAPMLDTVHLQAFSADGPFTASWLLAEGQGVLQGPKTKTAARAGAIAGMSSALSLIKASG